MTAQRIPLAELEQGTPFEQRHIGPDQEARAKMLAHVGYGSLDELTAAAVPDVIKNADALDLPGARTDAEVLAELRSLADRNQVIAHRVQSQVEHRTKIVAAADLASPDFVSRIRVHLFSFLPGFISR